MSQEMINASFSFLDNRALKQLFEANHDLFQKYITCYLDPYIDWESSELEWNLHDNEYSFHNLLSKIRCSYNPSNITRLLVKHSNGNMSFGKEKRDKFFQITKRCDKLKVIAFEDIGELVLRNNEIHFMLNRISKDHNDLDEVEYRTIYDPSMALKCLKIDFEKFLGRCKAINKITIRDVFTGITQIGQKALIRMKCHFSHCS